MSKVSVVYWSQSGNTQAMAEAVAAGITEAGKEAEVVYVSDVNVADLTAEKAFALGCPAMGAEVLEEGEFEPFMESIDGSISGKTIALFGSYGWGDGQWMREWAERVTGEGATVVNGEGLICQETPDDAMIEECKISARRWLQTPENFKTKRFSIISCLIKFLTQQKDSYHEG